MCRIESKNGKLLPVFTCHFWIPNGSWWFGLSAFVTTVLHGYSSSTSCGNFAWWTKVLLGHENCEQFRESLQENNHMTPSFHNIVGGNCHFIMTSDQKCKRLCFSGWFCHSVCRIVCFLQMFVFSLQFGADTLSSSFPGAIFRVVWVMLLHESAEPYEFHIARYIYIYIYTFKYTCYMVKL